MKKKYFAIICMVLMLSFVGLFSSNNFNSNKVVARHVLKHDTREFNIEMMGATLAFQPDVMGVNESKVEDDITEDILVNNTNPPTPTVSIKPPAEPQKSVDPVNKDQQNNGNNTDNPTVAEENINVEEDEVPSTESIIIGDKEYFIEHGEKFSHLINIADKYGAMLYSIPSSDVFAIVKEDGTPILHKSTGYVTAKLNQVEILYDVFSNHGDDIEGIANGIQHVIETGEDVNVEGTFEPYGYAILKKDDWIAVSW